MEGALYSLKESAVFSEHLKKHLLSGQKKLVEKVFSFLKEIVEHPTTGTGQVEQLKGFEQRLVYSRRIDKKHRLIYEIFEEEKRVEILSAYGHYDEK